MNIVFDNTRVCADDGASSSKKYHMHADTHYTIASSPQPPSSQRRLPGTHIIQLSNAKYLVMLTSVQYRMNIKTIPRSVWSPSVHCL